MRSVDDLYEKRIVAESGYFNTDYYTSQLRKASKTIPSSKHNQDFLSDPLQHYLDIGWRKGLNPSVYFNTQFYLDKYPDVLNFGNPLVHYLMHGQQEGRIPTKPNKSTEKELIAKSTYFDSEFYLKQISKNGQNELLESKSQFDSGLQQDLSANILEHYLNIGWHQGLNPSVYFDTQFYLDEYSDVLNFGNPLVHYLVYGKQEGRFPTKLNKIVYNSSNQNKIYLDEELRISELITASGYFDENYYREQLAPTTNPANALKHFMLEGWHQGYKPSIKFDTKFYIAKYPEAIENPLIDYLVCGKHEGKFATENEAISKDIEVISQSNSFDEHYYLENYSIHLADHENALHHFVSVGWKHNFNPSCQFDTKFYRSTNQDVTTNPLVHYVSHGWHEGRTPSLGNEPIENLIKADITNLSFKYNQNIPISQQKLKLAVVIHFFYEDLIHEILSYLDNIDTGFDLIITTSKECYPSIKEATNQFNRGICKIFITENIGKDIGPFLTTASKEIMTYDLVCKIHTKKSKHDPELRYWRKHIFHNLLGSNDIIQQILFEFKHDSTLGMIYPILPPSLVKIMFAGRGWAKNWTYSQNLLKTLGIQVEPWNEFLEFPAGSMFWFRPKALEPLLELEFSPSDFEDGQILDGSLSHAIERIFSLVVRKQNFTTKRIFLYKNAWVKSLDITDNIFSYLDLDYISWIDKYESNTEISSSDIENVIEHQPKISIILATYNTEEKYLHSCIQSVLNQSYSNWELCIADDSSSTNSVINILNHYAQYDTRIKVIFREKNGHISKASNSYFRNRSPTMMLIC